MATTWAAVDGLSRKATCTTGSESIAYNDGATAGVPVSKATSIVIVAEAVTAGSTLVNGTLQCYYYNSITGYWIRMPDLDLSLGTSTYQGFTFTGPSPGVGIPVIGGRGDRIAWVPNGVTISAGNMTVYHLVS